MFGRSPKRVKQHEQLASGGEQERSLNPNWSASLPWIITRAPPAIAQISHPEPSSVSGPKPRIASAKIVGNMMEWKNPTAIRLYIAVGPAGERPTIITRECAGWEKAASTFSGGESLA